MSKPIYNKLIEYRNSNDYPWHMPGHKRNMENILGNPYSMDFTEIDGLDDLHNPSEMILESMKNAAEIYKTKESLYLINGSTSGLLIAISAVCGKRSKIIMGRNCHKSVYNTVKLMELDPVYIYSEKIMDTGIFGGVSPEKLEQLIIENPDAKCVVITSPTYEGVVSDIKKISNIVHKNNMILIVDEAHGAHFNFGDTFPNSAVDLGGDLVVQSLHKTLPALTQAAILHICSDKINNEKIKEYYSIYQTSSPSYLIMASIDYCIDFLSNNKNKMFEEYCCNINKFRKKCSNLINIKLLGKNDVKEYAGFDYDDGKLVLIVKNLNINGHKLGKLLKEKNQIIEMEEIYYVILMTSIMDTKEAFDKLYTDLMEIDATLKKNYEKDDTILYNIVNKKKYIPSDTADMKYKLVEIEEAKGSISQQNVYIYPPGIPIVAAGEEINENVISIIEQYLKGNLNIVGLQNNKIKVINNEL